MTDTILIWLIIGFMIGIIPVTIYFQPKCDCVETRNKGQSAHINQN